MLPTHMLKIILINYKEIVEFSIPTAELPSLTSPLRPTHFNETKGVSLRNISGGISTNLGLHSSSKV